MIPDYDMTIDGVEFDTLAQVQEADYSWYAEAVLRRKTDGAMFFFSDSGCSCSYFAEGATLADLEPIFSMAEAYRKSSERERLKRSYETRQTEWI